MITDDKDVNPVLAAALNQILREVRDSRKQIDALLEDNLILRKENAEIKSVLSRIQKLHSSAVESTSPPNATSLRLSRRESRGRNPSRNASAGSRHGSGRRNPSILRNSVNTNTRGRGSSNAVLTNNSSLPQTAGNRTAPRKKQRALNSRVIGDSSYHTAEAKAKLVRALPIATVKYCSRNVFLTL